jgi:ADP-dependent NAD(P)H-hydrate dehydratase / NAD(P)H-hydrate epimerase
MRAADAWAIGEGAIPSIELMERAGRALAEVASELAPDGLIVVAAGKGNNGGDGLVAARHLRSAGHTVEVLLAGGAEDLTGDARINLERLPDGAPISAGSPISPDARLIVDALLGTGATGAPHGAVADAIAAIGDVRVPVLAADVPSGVNASTGVVAGAAVSAATTVTFHAAKPGLWIEPGRAHAGRVRVVDIGIPLGAPLAAEVGLIHDELLDLLPRRGVHSTKFTSGPVLVAGGSRGLTGAPCLSALAAQRAGAGYVTVCAPKSVSSVFESRLLEAMTLALPDDDGAHVAAGVAPLVGATERGGALVIGPGLGRSDGAREFARGAMAQVSLATVLDADGLGAFAGQLDLLRSRSAATVLTPHEGELARLLGLKAGEIAAERLRYVREAAAQSGAVVVLKGDDTLIAEPGGAVAVSPGATPGLATAGTGDVLAGVVGALLASGLEPFVAACAAVRLHALAGVRAAERNGRDGMIASDVIAELSAVRSR